MKKHALLPAIALMGIQAASLDVSAQYRESRPGAGGVQCWINADGKQQCQGGDYITPPDDNNRPRPRPDDGVRPPRPRPDDDYRPRPPHHRPDPYYPPYNPPSEPYYPPSTPSEPYYPPYTPPQDPYPPYQPPTDPYYPPSQPPSYPGVPNYSIQQFRNEEQQVLSWQQRYQQLPSNSWDARYALEQMTQAVQRATAALQDPRAFDGMSLNEVDAFAVELNNKYASVSSNTVVGRFYLEVLSISFEAMKRVGSLEIQRLNYDWRQLDALANVWLQKYQSVSSNTIKGRAYLEVLSQAFNALPTAVQQETIRAYDFRQVEQIAEQFLSAYQQTSSNTIKGRAYLQVLSQAYSDAQVKFQSQVRMMHPNEIYQIQDEYNRRLQQTSSNTIKGRYLLQIRETARAALGIR